MNYLRVRGEYTYLSSLGLPEAELPPRARRIHHQRAGEADIIVNYLRVRGEYTYLSSLGLPEAELPPRARRIPYPGRG